MSGTNITVHQAKFPSVPEQVTLAMPRERAELLFHDVNRLLALIDEAADTRSDGNGGWQLMDAGDQGAYDRTNEVLAQLQRELGIDPEAGR